jgi:diguanylate cyclase (GGDEF)-like protein
MIGNGPTDYDEDGDVTPPVHAIAPEGHGERRPCLIAIAGPRTGEIFVIEQELMIGRDAECSLVVGDNRGVSRRHAVIACVGDQVVVRDLGSANGTWVDGERIAERPLTDGVKLRVGETSIFRFARYDRVEESAQRQLLAEALRDGLTGAFNRRYFMQRLEAEVRYADRHGQPLSLAMFDIDDFKRVNDRHGHQAGDRALVQLVELIDGGLRTEDVMARVGGEELVVLMRNIPLRGGVAAAERLRRAIADNLFLHAGQTLSVTVSVGVAAYPISEVGIDKAAARLVELADAAMYRAKRAGKNRVCE